MTQSDDPTRASRTLPAHETAAVLRSWSRFILAEPTPQALDAARGVQLWWRELVTLLETAPPRSALSILWRAVIDQDGDPCPPLSRTVGHLWGLAIESLWWQWYDLPTDPPPTPADRARWAADVAAGMRELGRRLGGTQEAAITLVVAAEEACLAEEAR